MNIVLVKRSLLTVVIILVGVQSASAVVAPQTSLIDQGSYVTKTWWRGSWGGVHPGPGPAFMATHPVWDLNHPGYSSNPWHWNH